MSQPQGSLPPAAPPIAAAVGGAPWSFQAFAEVVAVRSSPETREAARLLLCRVAFEVADIQLEDFFGFKVADLDVLFPVGKVYSLDGVDVPVMVSMPILKALRLITEAALALMVPPGQESCLPGQGTGSAGGQAAGGQSVQSLRDAAPTPTTPPVVVARLPHQLSLLPGGLTAPKGTRQKMQENLDRCRTRGRHPFPAGSPKGLGLLPQWAKEKIASSAPGSMISDDTYYSAFPVFILGVLNWLLCVLGLSVDGVHTEPNTEEDGPDGVRGVGRRFFDIRTAWGYVNILCTVAGQHDTAVAIHYDKLLRESLDQDFERHIMQELPDAPDLVASFTKVDEGLLGKAKESARRVKGLGASSSGPSSARQVLSREGQNIRWTDFVSRFPTYCAHHFFSDGIFGGKSACTHSETCWHDHEIPTSLRAPSPGSQGAGGLARPVSGQAGVARPAKAPRREDSGRDGFRAAKLPRRDPPREAYREPREPIREPRDDREPREAKRPSPDRHRGEARGDNRGQDRPGGRGGGGNGGRGGAEPRR